MLNCSEYSERQVRRAAKAQAKDFEKIQKCVASIDETNTLVSSGRMNASLGDAYNARDKKRIDRLTARIAARSEKFGAVDGFSDETCDDDAPRKAEVPVEVAEVEVADVDAPAVEGDDEITPTGEVLLKFARHLHKERRIGDNGMQSAERAACNQVDWKLRGRLRILKHQHSEEFAKFNIPVEFYEDRDIA